MTYSNYDAVARFVIEGKKYGGSRNIFAEGDTLYSYGYHFPMLIRRDFGFLLNDDHYSVTTSHHQSICRSLTNYRQIEISFSTLESMGIAYEELAIIARGNNPYTSGYDWYRVAIVKNSISGISYKHQYINDEEYQGLPSEYKQECMKYHGRIHEAFVIEYKGDYYLSSKENGHPFIYKLPHSICDINEAFDYLMPDEVRGTKHYRQGEWFFVEIEPPHTLFWKDAKGMYLQMLPNFQLPNPSSCYKPYTATRGCIHNGEVYISGRVRHCNFRCLKLSTADNPRIFRAYQNLGALQRAK